MYWNSHDMNGWGWATMSFGTLLVLALMVIVGVLLYRALDHVPARPHTGDTPPAPEQALAQRYALGEIDDDEYRRRLAVLRESASAWGEHLP